MELERRLAYEKNISRSWQSNLRALQREVRLWHIVSYCTTLGVAVLRLLHRTLITLLLSFDIYTQLRDHLSDLAVASRRGGLSCSVFRGTLFEAGQAAAKQEVEGLTRSERESLRLLRLARDRVCTDGKRRQTKGQKHRYHCHRDDAFHYVGVCGRNVECICGSS